MASSSGSPEPGAPRLQPLARRRLAGLGEAGRAWYAALPGLLADLERAWGLRVERRSLPGGSNGFVAAATTAAGEARVVKVAAPGVDPARQAAVLAAAGGRGHVRLHAYDPGRRALLLDRLGPSLVATSGGGGVENAVDALCATLREVWAAPRPEPAVLAGPVTDRAAVLAAEVREKAGRLDHDVTPAVLARALACAERRSAAHDPAAVVTAHGDPHPANLLRAHGSPTGWLLVDAEGVVAEPAYDVGIVLRDFSSHLQDPATAPGRLRGWVRQAAAATGTDPAAVADWAYLERVSTGLHLTGIGSRQVARPLLTAAAALLP